MVVVAMRAHNDVILLPVFVQRAPSIVQKRLHLDELPQAQATTSGGRLSSSTACVDDHNNFRKDLDIDEGTLQKVVELDKLEDGLRKSRRDKWAAINFTLSG